MNISFMPSVFHPERFSLVKIDGVLASIKNGDYAKLINALPDSTLYPDKYKEQKAKTLPAWVLSGGFKDRILNVNFVDSNGLMNFDIDNLINGMVAKTKQNLIDNCPHLYALWKSPSGNGLKGLIRIPDDLIHNDADFKKAFYQIEAHLLGLGVTIDKSCKDICRKCFVCSDADIYINTDAPAFMLDMSDKPKPAQPIHTHTSNDTAQKYINRCCNIITNSTKGDYHAARLRAGKLAGGYIATGFINEYEAIATLERASRMVSAMCGDNEAVTLREIKAVMDGINEGKLSPVEGDKPQYRAQRESIELIEQEQPEVFEAQEWQSDLSADIDFMIPAHFGIAADIQRWILDTSVKRQPAIALAATLSILSVVVGRHRQCDGIKGNIISVCLAESGEGKDHPLKCVDKILNAIGMGGHISGQLASGAALFEAVHKKCSVVLMLDEIGHYFTGINGKGANQYSKEIMPMITEMYTSANYQFRDKARAGREGEIVKEPNLSVIGMTTERQIIDNLRSSDVADGSLARFFVLFGNNNVLINTDSDKLNSNDVPQSIIDGLENLKNEFGGNDDLFLNSKLLPIADDYRALKMRLMVDFNNKGIECGQQGGNNAIFKPFYARLAVKAVCISLLVDQCQSVEILAWCADLVEKAQDVFVKKFLHLASDNENERLVKIIERAIKEAGKKGIVRKALYDKTKQVPTVQKNLILVDLLESDKIFTQQVRINGSQKPSTVYFWRK